MSIFPPDSKAGQTALLNTDIAILGAGFSGSLLAVQLARKRTGPRVLLIDKSHSHGAGLAFGAAGVRHLLNVPAGRMSAFPDKPDHFLEWLRQHPGEWNEFALTEVEAGSFLPRRLYGRYLTGLVTNAAADSGRLELADAEVTDITRADDGTWRLSFASGETLTARAVVLALGNFPSTHPIGISPDLLQSEAYLPSPWTPGAIAQLAGLGDVLLLGTGLTALDVLGTLRQAKAAGRVHLLSRRGLVPMAHIPVRPHDPIVEWQPQPSTVRELLRRVRREIRLAAAAGVDWRAVIDSLRASTQSIWKSWNQAERSRFLRHVRPWWEVVRHRAAPQSLEALTTLRENGMLEVHAGRLQRLDTAGEGAVAVFRPRRGGPEKTIRVSAVLNCTGPETDLTRVDSPLVKQLIHRRLIMPDELGLGVKCAEDGSVLHADGTATYGLYALGALRKGQLWETTAVPELRQQAADLAKLLYSRWTPSDQTTPAANTAALPLLERVWAYEI